MYSKKYFNLSFLFCIMISLSSLISSLSGTQYTDKNDAGRLSYDYYSTSCPRIESMVQWGVSQATKKDPRTPASLLRLHFHDCFVDGCDASVLLQDTANFSGEQNAGPNKNSIRGMNVIDDIKTDAEIFCPKTVSCADILTLAARASVVMAGGPSWDVTLGRLDGLTANQSSPNQQLPSPLESVKNITAKFKAKGLDTKDMVILSGAHTIGFAHCFTIKKRLFNFSGSGKSDPSIAPALLASLQKSCPNVNKSNTKLVPLDPQSTSKFDNEYYKNVVNNKGLFQSDQELKSDSKTGPMVNLYSSDQTLFFNDFAASMAKLGNIGVLTKNKGEIRNKCGFVNKKNKN